MEQDVAKIVSAVAAALGQLPPSALRRAVRVAVSGQMHGLVLWKRDSPDAVSNLFTWEDQRCSPAFLANLATKAASAFASVVSRTGGGQDQVQLSVASLQRVKGLHSGYGAATLAWLSTFQPSTLARYDAAGTIMDYVVAVFCGPGTAPVMEPTTAHRYGTATRLREPCPYHARG